jgi:GntR family transcriptional regulator
VVRLDYEPGSKLPTEAELGSRYGVSRQTIRRAFQDLVADGLVYRVPGRGTFVAQGNSSFLRQYGSIDDLMSLPDGTTSCLLAPLSRRIDVAAAGRLGLRTDVVYSLTYSRGQNAGPHFVTTVWLPPAVAELILDVPELRTVGATHTTVLALLDSRLAEPVAAVDQSVTVGVAEAAEAAQLGVLEGLPVLRFDRLYYDTQQAPVELAVSTFLAEQYSYRVRLTKSTR